MILGYTNDKIVEKAVEYQSQMTDGVTQYDYETGKLLGASFTTGETENPENPVIEVFRLPQGERGKIDCRCYETGECPFWIESDDSWGGHFDDEMTDEWGFNRLSCCIDGVLEDWDLEEEVKEHLEIQIREVLDDHLGETISKLNEIRIEFVDRVTPWKSINVRQDNWELDVLDDYVDTAIENGFNTSISPIDYLCGYIEDFCLRYEEDKVYADLIALLRDGKLDEALKMLQ